MNKLVLGALVCVSLGAANLAHAAGPVELSGAKVTVKKWSIGEAKGKFYLNFEAMAKLSAAYDAKAMMASKFECKVGDQEIVDTPMVLGGTKLKELSVGQSTKLSVLAYGVRNAMDSKPTQCSITLTSSTGYGAKKQTTEVAAFCWKGKAVAAGACAK